MAILTTTITGGYAPDPTANPFTVASTGEITAASGYALSLTSSTNWYLLNQGLITASSGDAIDMASGTIVNQASIGGTYGVVITGTGSVFNQGTIAGGVTAVLFSGPLYVSNASTGAITGDYAGIDAEYHVVTVINAGTISGGAYGIHGNDGVSVVNTGTILGAPGISGRQGVVDITNAAGAYIGGYIYVGQSGIGTIVNAGTIAHLGNPDAIDASYNNATIDVVVDPGAVFTGTVAGNANDTLEFAAGASAGTFSYLGSQYTGFGSYTVDAGATWTATGTNIVAGTLIDAGTLYGTLTLDSTGAITVEYGGLISGGGSALAMLGGHATNAGLIEAGSDAISIYGAATLTNSGTILDGGGGRGNAAVYVEFGGLKITNQAGGTISANYYAILDQSGLLALDNAGTIFGTHRDAIYGNDGLNLTNTGAIHASGNYAAVGGRYNSFHVSNAAGAYIGGGLYGVQVDGGVNATIVNAGTIGGSRDAVRIGRFAGAYHATGTVVVDPGAVFQGTVASETLAASLQFAAGTTAGTFAGLGSQYTGFGSATVDAGASWTATGTNILDGIAVDGSLAIAGYAQGPAVLAGGALTVLGSATLAQYIGQAAIYGTGYLTNAGTITVTGGIYDVSFDAGGTVVNTGLIAGRYGIGITGAAGSVTNTGTILASGGTGSVINLAAGGRVVNTAGATISGNNTGIIAAGGVTVDNAGTILAGTATPGTYLDAVTFAPGAGNRLVVYPGAYFLGTLDGGNTLGAADASTLEFAAGASAGTFAALQSQYIDFGQISVDAGATWTASNANTLYAGQTLFNDGTIAIAAGIVNAVEVYGSAELSNAVGATITGGNFNAVLVHSGASLVNAGLINSGIYGGAYVYAGGIVTNLASGTLAGSRWGFSGNGGTLVNAGTIIGGYVGADSVYFTTVSAARLVVDPGAVFEGTVSANTIDSLEFAAGTAAGTFTGLGSQYIGFGTNAVTVDVGASWTAAGTNTTLNIQVAGTLAIAGTAEERITLQGGTVSVLAGGIVAAPTISGDYHGGIYGIGYANNAGLVTAAGYGIAIAFYTGGTVTNSGTVIGGDGIFIGTGGAGTVTNSGTILGSELGVYFGDGGTLTNSGTIAVTGTSNGSAISFLSGGTLTNSGTISETGRRGSAIYLAAGGTVTNSGTISASGAYGNAIYLRDGGTVTNSGTISADASFGTAIVLDSGGTVTNSGTILTTAILGTAIRLATGDIVTNSGAILETAYLGTAIDLATGGTITNSGTILASGRGGNAIVSTGGGTVTNSGTISASGFGSRAVSLSGGGTVTNSGTISASGTYGDAAYLLSGTITNSGTILATGVSANAIEDLQGTIAITNQVGGTIGGTKDGVRLAGNVTGTVINAGTIAGDGGNLYAVYAYSAQAIDIVIDPGAVFEGKVRGNATDTLELASGTTAGTFTGLGSQYINFRQVSIDSGATWTAAGSNTLAGGDTLRGPGLLIVASTLVNYGNITGGTYGVSLAGGATLINSGSITNTAGSQFQAAVQTPFAEHGSVALTNATGGVIASQHTAIYDGGGVLTVVNQGSISAHSNYAIYANAGLTLDNTGFIASSNGSEAVTVRGSTAHISNALSGVISAGDIGVLIESSSSTIINDGTIDGFSTGVLIEAGDIGTVINAGTIASQNGDAIAFHHGYASRLVVDPGAVFIGAIDGANTIGASVVSTLEFAAGTGTLAGFGTTIDNFAAITLDAGANWLLAGSAYGLGGGETISGLTAGSTLELTGTVESYAALAGGMLTLSDGTTLDLPGLAFADVTNDGTNTFITACFASGTRIADRFGNVPVEALRAGDLVRTTRGELAPVRWMGFRRIDLARHPRPLDVMPVRVHAHAFGDGLPARDLVLSPDHAVYVDGRLIPIRYLINNVSIVQETRAAITYWHVELDEHDIILAENLPCESYLDTGNRSAFENAPGAVRMTADFARGIWATQGCAPIVTDPADPALRALHTTLLARAIRTRRAA